MGCALVMAKIECLLGSYIQHLCNRIYWNGKNVECKLNALVHKSTFHLRSATFAKLVSRLALPRCLSQAQTKSSQSSDGVQSVADIRIKYRL